MTDTLARRGPDNDGFFFNSNALFGHRRLIVVDPEGGRQPMTKQLLEALEEAVKANDIPGMADVDSSLYLFCRSVREKSIVALSGECASSMELILD
ncbi:MAG: hypothetical protein KGZ81_13710 [Flavobacteriales bacterium]|nr:hypothetical protein [Flavobacteriales bacterium]